MNNKNKIPLLLCLLPIIILNVLGTTSFLQWQIQRIHIDQDNFIQNNDIPLQTLTLSQADFQGAQTRKGEINWQGNMYDIAKTQSIQDSIIIYYIPDEQEDQILSKLNDALQPNPNQNTKPQPLQWIKLACLPYIIPSQEIAQIASPPLHTLFLNSIPKYNKRLFSSYLSNIPHPPSCV